MIPGSKSFHFEIFWKNPNQNQHSLCSESNIDFSGMKGLRQQYSAKDLSWLTVDLLEINWRPGTLIHYKTGWQKWSSWCLSKAAGSVYAGINFVLNAYEIYFQKD